jgi:hypothetical protein
MASSQWRGISCVTLSVVIGVLSPLTLLVTILLAGPSFAEVEMVEPSSRTDDTVPTGHAVLDLTGISPTLQLLAFQPSESGYLFRQCQVT